LKVEKTGARLPKNSTFNLQLSTSEAIHMTHFPEELAMSKSARRLALDEFIELQAQSVAPEKIRGQRESACLRGDNH